MTNATNTPAQNATAPKGNAPKKTAPKGKARGKAKDATPSQSGANTAHTRGQQYNNGAKFTGKCPAKLVDIITAKQQQAKSPRRAVRSVAGTLHRNGQATQAQLVAACVKAGNTPARAVMQVLRGCNGNQTPSTAQLAALAKAAGYSPAQVGLVD